MGKCIKCGIQFIGTAASIPPDGLCHYCERDKLKKELRSLHEQVIGACPVDYCITYTGHLGQYVSSNFQAQRAKLDAVKAELATAAQQASDGEKGWLVKYSDTRAELDTLTRQNAALLAEVRFWSGEHKHAGDCEFGEEGCYLCRNAEREHFLKITKPLLANAGTEYVPRAEVDALKRQNAAMQSVLELLLELALPLDLVNRIQDAMPPDAGAELLTPEQVKPLVEAAEHIAECAGFRCKQTCAGGYIERGLHAPDCPIEYLETARTALAHARSLGF